MTSVWSMRYQWIINGNELFITHKIFSNFGLIIDVTDESLGLSGGIKSKKKNLFILTSFDSAQYDVIVLSLALHCCCLIVLSLNQTTWYKNCLSFLAGTSFLAWEVRRAPALQFTWARLTKQIWQCTAILVQGYLLLAYFKWNPRSSGISYIEKLFNSRTFLR